ncbi:MAG: K+/H+ antiporter [Bacteroidetes bacterium GWC2_33_15]|nr:MAG: K+/H+ antiporter [Bacteroidetes bacterium GWA2_33_15]OFX50853.1 MAG: K+/H+ antiporter [Bacteroidetes bacterium GWC2_33_15]OFX62864.1 MAG: K+/H+ antiporter [Bacteroidetes bacterium GWB2_32_14]OFX69934.1 MAG: K+/H+ antiporter [Bacteroidetes bacterium GWD2_33_33]HAN18926.1 potassium/proton antiporter [Bacteroidales bacterium]
MNLTTENILLIGSILLFISLFAGKTSYKFGVPVLILFISIGMLAGSDGIGGIIFDNPKTTQFIGIVALNFILFSGGLDTDWNSIKPIVWQGITLSTLGVMLTAFSVGFFVWAITDFTLFEGLLLGSIVSSTDSAAVFSILRSKKLALKGNLRPTLELESGSNDPMAYILTIVFTGLVINQDSGLTTIIPMFLRQLLLGTLLGFVFGKIGAFVINKIKLDYEGLYIVLVIALMFFSFSATDFIGGNGFLAVYLCAIYLGNQELIHKKKILKSFDSFAWLMQIILFLTLGLLVFPGQIIPVMGIGLIISLFLIVIARPLSVFISLIPFKVKIRGKLFISWVGLRGAVPIVFATYPLLAGAGKANMIFNLVFFISITSVLIQGTTLPTIAKWLHLTLPLKLKQRTLADLELSDSLKSLLTEIVIPETSPLIGRQIVQLGLPKTTLISFILRNNKYITPTGSTTLTGNDKLFVLSENKDSLSKVFECLEIKNTLFPVDDPA